MTTDADEQDRAEILKNYRAQLRAGQFDYRWLASRSEATTW
ncbi:hypothetical protein SRABI83_04010 [Arthrobacter sp. Bi83]|jgi:hypothetical protein|nr:hypothetical protein [Arthrobacter sp. Bi83]CAH0284079.1 hypothetical protein SRABI83_04010 [Arthrobacter sp. Bi83]